MSEYKYQIENSIFMEVSYSRIVQQEDFKNEIIKKNMTNERCHIYMVCSRPRITFEPDTITIDENYVQGRFRISRSGPDEFHHFKQPNRSELQITDYILEYPYRDIYFLNKDGVTVSGGKAPYLYGPLTGSYNDCLDLKVLYVGQAYGTNGQRIAADRLISHSTLQEIYSDMMSNSPHEEVWLILLDFSNYSVTMAGGDLANATNSREDSLEHFMRFFTSEIPIDQQVTFTEAALIKYFEPHYNTEYKTSFPSSSHSSYSHCYELDVNSIGINLDTEILVTRLYSETVAPSFHHDETFPLHSPEERRSMFEWFIDL